MWLNDKTISTYIESFWLQSKHIHETFGQLLPKKMKTFAIDVNHDIAKHTIVLYTNKKKIFAFIQLPKWFDVMKILDKIAFVKAI